MHGPGASEGDEGKPARVEAPLDGDDSEYLGHDRVGDPDHAGGDFIGSHLQLTTQMLEGRPSISPVHGHPAVEQALGVQPSEHQVRVGNRRFLPACAVAGRSRVRPCAHGADVEGTSLIRPGYGPAAGAALGQVYEREADGVPAPLEETPHVDLPGHLVLRDDLRHPTPDGPSLRRRPSHVEADHLRPSDELPKPSGRDDPRSRARLDDGHGPVRDDFRSGHAPV